MAIKMSRKLLLPLKTKFGGLRLNSCKQGLRYFFIDTNVVIDYDNDLPDVRGFVDDPRNVLYYTETVKRELSMRSGEIHEKFIFYHSKLTPKMKDMGVKMLAEIWHKRFSNPYAMQTVSGDCIRDGFSLDDKHLAKFRNNLFIIFEASSSCHDPGVLPDDMFVTPPLLTRNTDLLKKFIIRKETEDVLENTINLCGFEHLLPVVDLNDAIDEWRETQGK
jgi:hypothetical protein